MASPFDVRAFLDGLFPGVCIEFGGPDDELWRLRNENARMREQLDHSRKKLSMARMFCKQLVTLADGLSGAVNRKPPSIQPDFLMLNAECEMSSLASSMKPGLESLNGHVGKQIVAMVVKLMADHFWVMVNRLFDKACVRLSPNTDLAHHVKVMLVLGNILLTVFRIRVRDMDAFVHPKSEIRSRRPCRASFTRPCSSGRTR
jgi:hypothetical protein